MSFITQFQSEWDNPSSAWRGAPFWSWNAKLDQQRLTRAIESMHKAGMGGFFMHSRYGLKTPYLSEEWFRCVAACVEKARELGMKAYLYDEDRWPSGSAGGAVTREHPEYRQQQLVMMPVQGQRDESAELTRFVVQLDEAGKMISYRQCDDGAGQLNAGEKLLAFTASTVDASGWFNDGTYPDAMNPDAIAEFIHITHQAYADRFGKDFGGLIPAIFTDEPYYGNRWSDSKTSRAGIQWTSDLPRQFIRRFGYDLRERLPELFFTQQSCEFSKVRHDYRLVATELFLHAFSRQIGDWCHRNKIAMTGHYLCEDNLVVQTDHIGAAMPHYEHMHWPGIDILRDDCDKLATAKQCASVADQLGKERVLSEMYGCTGWDWPLEGHKFIGDWQYAVGVNFRCQHLTHYSLAGGAKRDYPASIFEHSPWWTYYKVVEDYFGRLSYALTRGEPLRDVLVVHPIQSAWGLHAAEPRQVQSEVELQDRLQEIIYTLSGQHYDWDFADESLLARHGQAGKRSITVGRLKYKLVVIPPCVTLRASTVELLKKFIAGGGAVLVVGAGPTMVDAESNPAAAELVQSAKRCGPTPAELIQAIEALLPRRVNVIEAGAEQTCVWTMLREVTGGRMLFLQSHDRKTPHRVTVRAEGKSPVVLWDSLTGERTELHAREADKATGSSGVVEFELDLPATGSALLSLGLRIAGAESPAQEGKVVSEQTFAGPFDVERTEPNTLPLDYCRFAVGDGQMSELVPVLKADELIRARYGLGTRLGGEHQPWYLYATGRVDTTPRDNCRMEWTFHVTDMPSRCLLAMESPQDFQISVNGKTVRVFDGTWVDLDIRTADVTALLKKGENRIELKFEYRPDMELEDMYLVGEFGVRRIDENSPRRAGNMTLIAPTSKLGVGSWVGQGLDFYTGAIKYRISMDKPAKGRVRISLPGLSATCAVVHVGEAKFVLPWAPFHADITDAMKPGANDVWVEVIGGRKNILGPLHTPWQTWTGPGEFSPNNAMWTADYLLTGHGLTAPVRVEVVE